MKVMELIKLEKQIEILEKEVRYNGKICKYCRFNGRNVDHPGYCPMLKGIPARSDIPDCSWFAYRDTKELIEIVRNDEIGFHAIEAEIRAKEAELKRKARRNKKTDQDKIIEPEDPELEDGKEDVEKFIEEVVAENEQD